MAEPKQPGFFKVIWVNRSSQTLEIPPSYAKHVKIKTSKIVNLKGPNGSFWTVNLIERDGKLYFEEGWPEFMKCHSLQDMDFCVFKYDGKVTFKVKIFDGKSCTKRDPFDAKCNRDLRESSDPETSKTVEASSPSPSLSVSEDAENASEEAPLQDHETSEDRTADSHEGCLSFVETMKYYNVSRSFVLSVPAWFINEHYSSNVTRLEIVLENEEGKQWPVNLLLKSTSLSGGWSQFVRDNHIKEGDTCTFQFVHTLKLLVHISRQSDFSQPLKRQHSQEAPEVFGDKKKRRFSCYDDDGDNRKTVADSDAKDFPSFTITVRKYRSSIQNMVRCSSKFMSTHCSNYGVKEKIVLENEEGKEWYVNMCLQEGHGLLSGGWLSFARDNRIKVKDKCTFKLIDERKMLVLISRHGSPLQQVKKSCKQRAKEYGMVKKEQAETEQEQKTDKSTRELEQLREENRRLMEMVKSLSTHSPP